MNFSVKTSLLLLLTITTIHPLSAQDTKTFIPIAKLDKQYQLTGELGKAFGTVVSVKGIVVEGRLKGYEGGPNLLVQFINDKATQQKIQIPLSPRSRDFDDDFNKKPETGSTYQMKVYETGGYSGIPADVMKLYEGGYPPQNSGFYFVNRLIIISAKKIEPVQWSPDQFIGQYALLAGIAKNDSATAVIQNAHWKLQLAGCQKWKDAEINKSTEVYGRIYETGVKGVFRVEECQPRLVKLADQLGKTVKLRGTAWSMNGAWWFNYRGTDLYVENMDKLPNWKVRNHGAAIEITGTLAEANLPDIHEYHLKSNDPLKKYYIVSNPEWKLLDELLTPELDFND